MIERRDTRATRLELLVVGVGGQGVLSAARWLGEAALASGLEVVVGQLHGMSQRGGSVESTVRIGACRSTFLRAGSADVVLGLEPLELCRARQRMSAATCALVSLGAVVPPSLSLAGARSLDVPAMLGDLRALAPALVAIDGPALVHEAGDPQALNVVMLGALAGLGVLPFDADALLGAILRRRSPKQRAAIRFAFELGLEAVPS